MYFEQKFLNVVCMIYFCKTWTYVNVLFRCMRVRIVRMYCKRTRAYVTYIIHGERIDYINMCIRMYSIHYTLQFQVEDIGGADRSEKQKIEHTNYSATYAVTYTRGVQSKTRR